MAVRFVLAALFGLGAVLAGCGGAAVQPVTRPSVLSVAPAPPGPAPAGVPTDLVAQERALSDALGRLPDAPRKPGPVGALWVDFLKQAGQLDLALWRYLYDAVPWDPDRSAAERAAFEPRQQWARVAVEHWQAVLLGGWARLIERSGRWLTGGVPEAQAARDELLRTATQLHDFGHKTDNADVEDAAATLYDAYLERFAAHERVSMVRRNLAILHKQRGNFLAAAELFEQLADEVPGDGGAESDAYQAMLCLVRALKGPNAIDEGFDLEIRDIAGVEDPPRELQRRDRLVRAVDRWLRLAGAEASGAAEALIVSALVRYHSHAYADAYERFGRVVATYPLHAYVDEARRLQERARVQAGIPAPPPDPTGLATP